MTDRQTRQIYNKSTSLEFRLVSIKQSQFKCCSLRCILPSINLAVVSWWVMVPYWLWHPPYHATAWSKFISLIVANLTQFRHRERDALFPSPALFLAPQSGNMAGVSCHCTSFWQQAQLIQSLLSSCVRRRGLFWHTTEGKIHHTTQLTKVFSGMFHFFKMIRWRWKRWVKFILWTFK